jgi:hypothetical protein
MDLEYESGVDSHKLAMLNAEDVLDNVFDIEDILGYIRSIDSEIDFLKRLKESRAKKIDAEISSHASEIDKLKSIIKNTMLAHEPDKKTIPFPGVGKVTRRKVPGKWVIEDEETFLSEMAKRGLKERVVRIKESIAKKEADEVLDNLQQKSERINGTAWVEPSESLSVSFEKVEEKPLPEAPKRIASDNIESLSALSV